MVPVASAGMALTRFFLSSARAPVSFSESGGSSTMYSPNRALSTMITLAEASSGASPGTL